MNKAYNSNYSEKELSIRWVKLDLDEHIIWFLPQFVFDSWVTEYQQFKIPSGNKEL